MKALFRSLVPAFLLAFSGLLVAAPDGRNLTVDKAGKRLALVIGNDSYRKVEALRNARTDAKAIAKELGEAGFDVSLHIDTDEKTLMSAIRRFKTKVRGGDEVVFYFAGHGVQLGGANYLLPIDIAGDNEEQVKDESLPLQRVLDDLQDQKARFSLAIVDACRNNPFRGSGRSLGGRGLAPTSAATGQMVLFAAGANQQALDRVGPNDRDPNGLFTRVLLKEMRKPGVPVGDVLRNVREQVVEQARSIGQEQVPALYDQSLGRFYFRPGDGTQVTQLGGGIGGSARTTAQIEDELWDAIKESDNPAVFEQYLAQYPNGRYVALANVRLIESRKKPMVAAPPAAAGLASGTISAAPETLFKDCPDCPEMVVIPAGTFQMGSDDEYWGKPVHTVRIAQPFALGKTHITRGQFATFVRATGHKAGNRCVVWTGNIFADEAGYNWQHPGFDQQNNHPVVCINVDDAEAYLHWLSQQTGKRYRLPSEAELEYAIRGNTTTSRWWGDNPDQACVNANVGDRTTRSQVPGWVFPTHNCNDGYAYTAPVGKFPANGFGLHDMMGNAGQLTEDCWNDTYKGAPSDGSAWTSGDCGSRVRRGGSWISQPEHARVTIRNRYAATDRGNTNGFRPAMTLP